MRGQLAGAVLALLTLSACETATVFQPAMRPGAVGYTDYRIEPGRYRISFQGGDSAPAAQVRDYVLLRAAQVTLRDGYDWFRIADREGSIAPPRHQGSLSFGIGGFNFGRGFSAAASAPPSPSVADQQIGRSIEIITGHGPIPTDGGAYDARGVQQNLGPRAAP